MNAPCTCPAYRFPHREGSGQCEGHDEARDPHFDYASCQQRQDDAFDARDGQ